MKSRWLYTLLITSYLIVTTAYNVNFMQSCTRQLFPGEVNQWKTVTSGNSDSLKISSFYSDSLKIKIDFSLIGKQELTSVGFRSLHKDIDFSKYDRLAVTFTETSSPFVAIHLITGEKENESLNHCFIRKGLKVHAPESTIETKLTDFYIPQWWYNHVNIDPSKDHVEPDFTRFYKIGFSLSKTASVPAGEPFTIGVSNITLKRDFTALIIVNILLISIFSVLHILIRMTYSKNSKQSISNELSEQVINYIGTTFTDPTFCYTHITTKFEIDNRDVDTILFRSNRCDLTSYLTEIRTTEAHRLLTESELQIKEIAFAVGYKHVATFNRAFRDRYNCTPGSVRSNS